MIVDIFSKENDDTPFIDKVDQFLKKHSVSCQSSFKPADFRIVPDFVTWEVTLIGKTQHCTNTQNFEYLQNVSLLPNYNRCNVLSHKQKDQQNQLISLATHYGLAVRKFCQSSNEVVKLQSPSAAHILAAILVKCSAIYILYPEWAKQNNLNEHNNQVLHKYQDCIMTAARINSLFEFDALCEISGILKDF